MLNFSTRIATQGNAPTTPPKKVIADFVMDAMPLEAKSAFYKFAHSFIYCYHMF